MWSMEHHRVRGTGSPRISGLLPTDAEQHASFVGPQAFPRFPGLHSHTQVGVRVQTGRMETLLEAVRAGAKHLQLR